MNRAFGGLIRRTVLATSVLLLIVGAAFGVVLISVAAQHETVRVTRHTKEIYKTVDQIGGLVVNMQKSQLQFTLTDDPNFLVPWQNAIAELPGLNARLDQLATTPAEQAQARQIDQATESFVHYSVPAVDAARRGDPSASSVATTQEGDRRSGEVQVQLADVRSIERNFILTRDGRIDATADRQIVAVVTGLGGSAVVIALVAGYQTRLLIRPIRRAAVMAGQLADGNLGTRIPETGKAEIGQLEHAFNTMAVSLERSHDELAQFAEMQTALRRVAVLVAQGVPPAKVMEAVAAELGRLIGTDAVRILRYEPDDTGTVVATWGRSDWDPVGTHASLDGHNVAVKVLRTGQAARMDSSVAAPGALGARQREHGIRAAVGVPIHVEGRLWGVVAAGMTSDEPLLPGIERRLGAYTDLIGTAIANAQTRADLVASRARFVLASDQARRRIERDLHDGVQQRLISLGLDVRRAEADMPTELEQLRQRLSAVVTGLNGAVEEVREVSRGVHPAILTEGGLRPALRALARRSAVAVELDMRLDDRGRLPEPVEVAAYYVVAEALTNAAKHAHATFIRVGLQVRDDSLFLSVRDDGIGGADPERGSGVVGLTDRVEALGGALTVDSPVGQGTLLQAKLPLEYA